MLSTTPSPGLSLVLLVLAQLAGPASSLDSVVVYNPAPSSSSSRGDTNTTSLAVVVSLASSQPSANSSSSAPASKAVVVAAAPSSSTNTTTTTGYAAPAQTRTASSYAASNNGYAPQAAVSSFPASSQAGYSYAAAAPAAYDSSLGYAAASPPVAVNNNNYYNYAADAVPATGYAAAPTGYAAEPYAAGFYDGNGQETATTYDESYYGYYSQAERQEAYGEGSLEYGAGTTDIAGVTDPPEQQDHAADLGRQVLLFVVAIVAILYGFFVTPWIVSGLGFVSGFLPLAITIKAPLINALLGIGGLGLCTVGPPPALFPGTTTGGRELTGEPMSLSPLGVFELVQHLLDLF